MSIKQKAVSALLEILQWSDGDVEAVSKATSATLSFDDIRHAIYEALAAIAPPAPPATITTDYYDMPSMYWVEDIYTDRVVFAWADGKTYEATYTVSGTTLTLADAAAWKEVYDGWLYAKEMAHGSIAKAESDEAPLVLIASGAFEDRDHEWATREFQENFAKGINDGSINMSVDWFHTGFKSRSNKTPSAEPIILGHIAKAAFENDHLALMPVFDDPAHEDIVRKEADTLGLSIWFGGVARDEDRAFRGKPSSRASVALTPRGYESYPYTAIRQE